MFFTPRCLFSGEQSKKYLFCIPRQPMVPCLGDPGGSCKGLYSPLQAHGQLRGHFEGLNAMVIVGSARGDDDNRMRAFVLLQE